MIALVWEGAHGGIWSLAWTTAEHLPRTSRGEAGLGSRWKVPVVQGCPWQRGHLAQGMLDALSGSPHQGLRGDVIPPPTPSWELGCAGSSIDVTEEGTEERAALAGWLVALSEPQCRGAGLWVGEEGAPSPPRAIQGQSPCLCLASPPPQSPSCSGVSSTPGLGLGARRGSVLSFA